MQEEPSAANDCGMLHNVDKDCTPCQGDTPYTDLVTRKCVAECSAGHVINGGDELDKGQCVACQAGKFVDHVNIHVDQRVQKAPQRTRMREIATRVLRSMMTQMLLSEVQRLGGERQRQQRVGEREKQQRVGGREKVQSQHQHQHVHQTHPGSMELRV